MVTEIPMLLWIAAGIIVLLIVWKILKKLFVVILVGLVIAVAAWLVLGKFW